MIRVMGMEDTKLPEVIHELNLIDFIGKSYFILTCMGNNSADADKSHYAK